MLLATALKTKAAAVILTAAVVGGGTFATVMATRHHDATAAAASVPLPDAPPTATPGPITNYAAPGPIAASPIASPAPDYSGAPVPAPSPAPGGYTPAPAAPYGNAPPPPQAAVAALSDQQLDQLLAPVALYPDPLIGEMLPATTYPDELAAAAQWLRNNPTGAGVDAQPWEPAIKALAHSPSVLIWMNNNADWTHTLGTAFTYQSGDVMASIQRLRGQAAAAGSLVDTPQQVVVYQASDICIEPASPTVLYVPVYDWRAVYTRGFRSDGITFFAGCDVGSWLDFDCDWDNHGVVLGAQWNRGWDHRWDGDHNARPVSVRNNNTIINKTTVNNTMINNTRVVQEGGTPWQRDNAKLAPTLPASVKTDRPDQRVREKAPPLAPRQNVNAPLSRQEVAPAPEIRPDERPKGPAEVPAEPHIIPAPPADRGPTRVEERDSAASPGIRTENQDNRVVQPDRATTNDRGTDRATTEDRSTAADRGAGSDRGRGSDRGNDPGRGRN